MNAIQLIWNLTRSGRLRAVLSFLEKFIGSWEGLISLDREKSEYFARWEQSEKALESLRGTYKSQADLIEVLRVSNQSLEEELKEQKNLVLEEQRLSLSRLLRVEDLEKEVTLLRSSQVGALLSEPKKPRTRRKASPLPA